MARIPASKKRKAFRMRLDNRSIAEVSRECKISRKTIMKLERGWTDKKGVHHPGWLEKLEEMQQREEAEELAFAMQTKEQRIGVYEDLAGQFVKRIKERFPNMKGPEAKAFASEIRELGRQIAIERGDAGPGRKASSSARKDITPAELRERYEDAQGVKVIEAQPPEEAQSVEPDSSQEEADR